MDGVFFSLFVCYLFLFFVWVKKKKRWVLHHLGRFSPLLFSMILILVFKIKLFWIHELKLVKKKKNGSQCFITMFIFIIIWCICQSFDSGEIDYHLFLDPSDKASLSLGVFYYYVVTFVGYLIFKMIIINVVLICIITL